MARPTVDALAAIYLEKNLWKWCKYNTHGYQRNMQELIRCRYTAGCWSSLNITAAEIVEVKTVQPGMWEKTKNTTAVPFVRLSPWFISLPPRHTHTPSRPTRLKKLPMPSTSAIQQNMRATRECPHRRRHHLPISCCLGKTQDTYVYQKSLTLCALCLALPPIAPPTTR